MAAEEQEAVGDDTTWQIPKSLERVWQEIKAISRQVEHENPTQRACRAAEPQHP